ncbi:DsbA family protein [Streptomyces sp. NPDC058757]|uniref:DsbA family protein n=1 Tax=Streptomyces sp. NPDC058757 TaxID=3346626 RepID=UPI003697A093
MAVRRTRRVLAAVAAAGLIGLAAVGCSPDGGASPDATGKAAAAPAAHAETLSVPPSAVEGTKIVVGDADAPHTVTADAGPGRFAAFRAALFAAQPADESEDASTAGHLLRIADRVDGLRGDAFDRAVREEGHRAWVADAEKAFEDSGVGGTPSVLVDGRALDGGAGLYDAGAFGRLLDGALGS